MVLWELVARVDYILQPKKVERLWLLYGSCENLRTRPLDIALQYHLSLISAL